MNNFSGVLFVCVLINVQNMKTKFLLVELAEGKNDYNCDIK